MCLYYNVGITVIVILILILSLITLNKNSPNNIFVKEGLSVYMPSSGHVGSYHPHSGSHSGSHPVNKHPVNKHPVNKHPVNKHPINKHPVNKHPINKHHPGNKWQKSHFRRYPHATYILAGYTGYDLYDTYFADYWYNRRHGYYSCGAYNCDKKSPIYQPGYDLYPCLQCADCGICQYEDGAMQCMPGDVNGPYDSNFDPSQCVCWYHGAASGCWPNATSSI